MKRNKNEWLKENYWHIDKLPKGCYNIITQPRRTQYKLFGYKGVNIQASKLFEWLLWNQGFITREQMECIVKDIKEGKLK